MIAVAITCLLVATVFVALLSATDSLIHGWRTYGALAGELRALRASQSTTAPTAGASVSRTTSRAAGRRPAIRAHASRTPLRAAA